jgi:hypothetical protein
MLLQVNWAEYSPLTSRRLRGSARIAAQQSLLLMHTCTCKILVSWHGSQSANTFSFRIVSARHRVFLDLRGMTYLTLETTDISPTSESTSSLFRPVVPRSAKFIHGNAQLAHPRYQCGPWYSQSSGRAMPHIKLSDYVVPQFRLMINTVLSSMGSCSLIQRRWSSLSRA